MPNDKDFDPCVICTTQNTETIPPTFNGTHQKCPRCGEFKISGRALAIVSKSLVKKIRAKLSGWVREQNHAGAVPMITGSNLDAIISRPLPTVIEQTTNLLQEAERGIRQQLTCPVGDN